MTHAQETAETPLVSVIVPVFNTQDYLDDALWSIRSQTLLNIEILCIDDASTDSSLEILRTHAAQDERVRLFEFERNRGLGAVRNFGVGQAIGGYVYFFDSDDLLEAEALQRLVDQADAQNLDVLFFNARPFIDGPSDPGLLERYERQYSRSHSYEPGIRGVDLMLQMTQHGEWKPSACLYLTRRELLENRSLAFAEGILHEDNGFTMRLMLVAGRVGYNDSAFFVRRVRRGSITTSEITSAHVKGLVCAIAELSLAPSAVGESSTPETASAVGVQAELLLHDAVGKYQRLTEEEQRAFVEWRPRSSVQLFVRHRLVAQAAYQEVENALGARIAEVNALSEANEAYRRSRVLRAARRVRALMPPYRG